MAVGLLLADEFLQCLHRSGLHLDEGAAAHLGGIFLEYVYDVFGLDEHFDGVVVVGYDLAGISLAHHLLELGVVDLPAAASLLAREVEVADDQGDDDIQPGQAGSRDVHLRFIGYIGISVHFSCFFELV